MNLLLAQVFALLSSLCLLISSITDIVLVVSNFMAFYKLDLKTR